MGRDLPPLSAIRAFEASARHRSFRRAAHELGITEPALRLEVKALEQYLGIALFYWATPEVVLTTEGADYLTDLTDALDRMAAATEHIRQSDLGGPLGIHATPAFAARWLMPRLAAFHEMHPEIELHVSTSHEPANFARGNVDIAVRFGRGLSRGFRVDPFLKTTRFPVASPGLLKDAPPLRHPDDLRHYTLLHDQAGADWQHWLKRARARHVNAKAGPKLAHCDALIQAAVDGLGVALAFGVLVVDDLAAGRLVRVFDVSLPERTIYTIVSPEAWSHRPRVAAFRNWLLGEARAPGRPTALARPAHPPAAANP